MMYGLELELILKAIYLKTGHLLYENNKLNFPVDGHDLADWINLLIPDYLKYDVNNEAKELIEKLMECLIDYGKYPFKKNINKEKDFTIYETDISDAENTLQYFRDYYNNLHP